MRAVMIARLSLVLLLFVGCSNERDLGPNRVERRLIDEFVTRTSSVKVRGGQEQKDSVLVYAVLQSSNPETLPKSISVEGFRQGVVGTKEEVDLGEEAFGGEPALTKTYFYFVHNDTLSCSIDVSIQNSRLNQFEAKMPVDKKERDAVEQALKGNGQLLRILSRCENA
jgi:hypothetical protein